MNDRPTPETDRRIIKQSPRMCGCHYESEIVFATLARRLERERDEAREWQAFLSGWGGTPEIVHEFIKGQQTRIHAAQEVERERDEAREELDELNKRLIEVSQLGVDLVIELENLRMELAAERALADKLVQIKEIAKYWHDVNECVCASQQPQGGCLRCDMEKIILP